MEQTYEGKYFSILGDSLSTLEGYNPPECAAFYDWGNKRLAGIYAPEDTWWGHVIQTLGGRLLVNHSYSGSTVTRHPACEIESYGCSDHRTGSLGMGPLHPDVVMVLMGLNDFGCGMLVQPQPGKDDLSVFSVAYSVMLERIRQQYPNAEIWCMTLPVSCQRSDPNFVPKQYSGGGHVSDYCQAIRTCAEKAGCRLFELYDPQNPYDTIDGYHPTAEGMLTIADSLLCALEREM